MAAWLTTAANSNIPLAHTSESMGMAEGSCTTGKRRKEARRQTQSSKPFLLPARKTEKRQAEDDPRMISSPCSNFRRALFPSRTHREPVGGVARLAKIRGPSDIRIGTTTRLVCYGIHPYTRLPAGGTSGMQPWRATQRHNKELREHSCSQHTHRGCPLFGCSFLMIAFARRILALRSEMIYAELSECRAIPLRCPATTLPRQGTRSTYPDVHLT